MCETNRINTELKLTSQYSTTVAITFWSDEVILFLSHVSCHEWILLLEDVDKSLLSAGGLLGGCAVNCQPDDDTNHNDYEEDDARYDDADLLLKSKREAIRDHGSFTHAATTTMTKPAQTFFLLTGLVQASTAAKTIPWYCFHSSARDTSRPP